MSCGKKKQKKDAFKSQLRKSKNYNTDHVALFDTGENEYEWDGSCVLYTEKK